MLGKSGTSGSLSNTIFLGDKGSGTAGEMPNKTKILRTHGILQTPQLAGVTEKLSGGHGGRRQWARGQVGGSRVGGR